MGYVSPDFRTHCQSFFTIPLLSCHDPAHVEVFCYSYVKVADNLTERLQSLAHHWRDVKHLTDEQTAELIREDRIDILVDLTMHMAHNRLLVFARNPAPVQVCWLAYPGTTGLTTMDYRLTDPYLDPPQMSGEFYSEESVRLPDTFWCYDPLATDPSVNELPSKTTGHITFGCLNNYCKVNANVLKLWSKVLRSVPDSRMMILCPEGSQRDETLKVLTAGEIAAERIHFVARSPRNEYLELYHHIDIGLDTFPYNGHTTSLDSYWMGVPVVTLAGNRVVGRAGVSQLTNLGLTELIARTPEEFVQIATALANDHPRLQNLRATLRERMQASPLMDGPRFAKNMEAAYRTLWKRWCQS